MLKSKYICQIVIFFLLFNCCELHNSFAHEGHDHSHDTTPVTIERSTYTHFKSVLSVYREIYGNLIKEDLNSISVLAQRLLDAASKGVETEPEGSGHHMMDHILQGAESLKQTEDSQEAQDAFASISEAIFPFFKSWPNQLKSNKIKLYQCKKHGHYWLQPQDFSPICPYASTKITRCQNIEEVIRE